ncbi:DNA recombination protein RmuC [Nesterenkonia sphaerica]|uniref:DNA recombination protein RmuC n=1 Tax=Nesterenkonia sphaerica TaxID=1804988 RepID=A0A5R9AF60_9MICC|nr:DNA recombination protein RmuC [Nesterenkonia sphaerica]TLP76794.1 DNA recombination protein RmuC [Nesterenkonia sphaerica]
MDWSMMLLGLLIGLVLGAALCWVATRRKHHNSATALSETQRALAAAEARLDEIQRRRADDQHAAQERESLLEILHPVRQGVTEMHRRIQELERERSAQHSQLSHQLKNAAQADASLLESTQALLGSLHSTSARGYWGEVQLRRVVEAAGMLPHVDFTEQHTGAGPEGEVLRPDMVVQLPGGRHLVIDAKAPLHAEDAELQAKALRARVDELSRKRYWEAVELSPEVVFCFLPAESLFSASLEADPGLLDRSLAKGVTLVSPSSLLAAMKAVETAWRQERLAANIKEVVDNSRELYRRLATMSSHLNDTGSRLAQAVTAYNKLIGNIERRVLPQAQALGRVEVGEPTDGSLEDLGETLRAEPLTAEVNPLGPRLSAGGAATP